MTALKATTAKPSPLGRGLSALFGDQDASYLANEVVRQPKLVPIEFLYPGKLQPRTEFDDEALQNLADSIKEKGVLQPLLVRRHPSIADAFEIIAGERRWRASQKAGLHELPVIVRDLNDTETLEIALIENIQRQDLNPLEEAEGYQRLLQEFGHSQDIIAKAVGKSRSHVANMLRLNSLPEEIKAMIRSGELSMGHARAILGAPDMLAMAQEVVAGKLSVREVEKRAQAAKLKAANSNSGSTKNSAKNAVDVDLLALEKEVTSWIGLAVKLKAEANGSGSLTINYQTLDQLEDVLKRLSVTPKIV